MLKSYSRTLPELQHGGSVYVQNRVRQREPAEVLSQNEIPRSFVFEHITENLKQALKSSPVSTHPQTDKDFIFYTDASNEGIAAALSKNFENEECVIDYFSKNLAFFDPRVESEIVVDASPFGLGGVLQQRGKPIAFASSTLTPAQHIEQRMIYAHIEKELVVVVYGCKKFHQYVYGTKFKIYSDLKPLIAMSKKPLSDMTPRMQRFYLQLQCYDYEIFYKSGKEMFVSDTLSRAPVLKNHTEEDSIVLSVLDSLPISDIKLQEISDADKSDPIVQELKSLLECGWDIG
ncbi:Retrovirus-related Pol polyprotein from transposon 297 [Araneus ventricosus]|uniref:Retrovirus-related Pol polyprotein from transposon 297 n=1 Tax=Araneus ventricosus TaxID=182803 RepID=A0A4Y2PEM6_ARAVE|nr:Retrovirus-related Pol polyprotein from transposon 297 [Araneus ventricosus]